MDINVMRSIVTVVSLLVFIGIVAWAWNARRKTAFDEAAQLPLLDDAVPTVGRAVAKEHKQ